MKYMSFVTVAAAAGGLLIAVSGCGGPTAAEPTDAARVSTAASVERVTAGRPQRKTLELYTSQPGRIAAFEQAPLFPKVSGYVEAVLVDIGDRIAKGQVLLKLWIPEMDDERTQKEALVALAEAQVAQAEAAVQSAQARVATAQARVRLAEAGIVRAQGDFDRWKSEHERIKQLADKGSVTRKLADESLNQFRSAEAARAEAAATVDSAKAEVNEAEANVSRAEADLLAAQAKRQVAKASLMQTKTMQAYAEIKAPFDGVVTRRGVDSGHFVHPANGADAAPLLVVARTDRVRVFVDVPEMEAPLVNAGDRADAAVVRVQSLRGREFEATVTRTSWSLDASNRSLRTEIDIPNEDGLLKPGMYAFATILLERRNDALVLPVAAVIRDGQMSYCCCVDSGKIVRRTVKLGLRSGDEVEILSGLEDSHTVVLARADSLQQGQAVEVIGAGE